MDWKQWTMFASIKKWINVLAVRRATWWQGHRHQCSQQPFHPSWPLQPHSPQQAGGCVLISFYTERFINTLWMMFAFPCGETAGLACSSHVMGDQFTVRARRRTGPRFLYCCASLVLLSRSCWEGGLPVYYCLPFLIFWSNMSLEFSWWECFQAQNQL